MKCLGPDNNFIDCNNGEFPDDGVVSLRILYGVGLLVWIIIIFYFGFFVNSEILGRIILILPVIVFIINMIVVFNKDASIAPNLIRTNLLTIFLIVAGTLVVMVKNPKIKGHRLHQKKKYYLAIMLSFFFLLFSHIECSVLKNNPLIENHFNLIINIYSLALMGYAISEIFIAEYGMVTF